METKAVVLYLAVLTALIIALVVVVGAWVRHFVEACKKSGRFRWDILAEFAGGILVTKIVIEILKYFLRLL